jgi:hypothetical protein
MDTTKLSRTYFRVKTNIRMTLSMCPALCISALDINRSVLQVDGKRVGAIHNLSLTSGEDLMKGQMCHGSPQQQEDEVASIEERSLIKAKSQSRLNLPPIMVKRQIHWPSYLRFLFHLPLIKLSPIRISRTPTVTSWKAGRLFCRHSLSTLPLRKGEEKRKSIENPTQPKRTTQLNS